MSAPAGFDWQNELQRKAVLQASYFGEAATYTPPGGGTPVNFKAVRINPEYDEPAAPGQHAIRWAERAAFASDPLPGGTVVIGSKSYDLTQVQDDGSKGLRLILSLS
jgi:hypothetical protein